LALLGLEIGSVIAAPVVLPTNCVGYLAVTGGAAVSEMTVDDDASRRIDS
jgi:hypothetical protein